MAKRKNSNKNEIIIPKTLTEQSPYASGIHVSAEAALTQVDQSVCFILLDPRTGWPTHAEVPRALLYKLVNLSERRFGAHIDATGIWRHREMTC